MKEATISTPSGRKFPVIATFIVILLFGAITCGAYVYRTQFLPFMGIFLNHKIPAPTVQVPKWTEDDYVPYIEVKNEDIVFGKEDGTTVNMSNMYNKPLRTSLTRVVANLSYNKIAYVDDITDNIGSLVISDSTSFKEISSEKLIASLNTALADEITQIQVVSWSYRGIVIDFHATGYLIGIAIVNPDTEDMVEVIDLDKIKDKLPRGIPIENDVHGTGRYMTFSTVPPVFDEDGEKKLQKEKPTVGIYIYDFRESRLLLVESWKYLSDSTNATGPTWVGKNKLVYSKGSDLETRWVDFDQWSTTIPSVAINTIADLEKFLAGHFFYGDYRVGSGYCEGIEFREDGHYVYSASQYDAKKTYLAETGTYTVTGKDTVVLNQETRLDLQQKKIAVHGAKTLRLSGFLIKSEQNADHVTMSIDGDGFFKYILYWEREGHIFGYSEYDLYKLTDGYQESPLKSMVMTLPKGWSRVRFSEYISYAKNTPLSTSSIPNQVVFTVYPSTHVFENGYTNPSCTGAVTVSLDLGNGISRKVAYCGDHLSRIFYQIPILTEKGDQPRIELEQLSEQTLTRDSQITKDLLDEVDNMVKSIKFPTL